MTIGEKETNFYTSALLKEFVSEDGSDIVDKLTTAAREGKIQIVTSVWSVNEAIGVIDRKVRKGELAKPDVQTIMATISERIVASTQDSSFLLTPVSIPS